MQQVSEVSSDTSPLKSSGSPREIQIGLLTGGEDRPYALGLAMALAAKNIRQDFIGSDQLESPELLKAPKLRWLNLRGDMRSDVPATDKVFRVLTYYARLLRYVATTRARIFHILWNNRFEYFDRTFMMAFYRLLGKKVVFTAHNVNARKRDGTDTALNRLTLRIQYRLCHHIFVHTDKMKAELTQDFGIPSDTVTVIPFGINETVPNTDLTCADAKTTLGVSEDARTILFFGRIGRYKGLEFLVEAFLRLAGDNGLYRLVVVGKPKGGSEEYLEAIRREIQASKCRDQVIQKIEFVPDEQTELYFKAADVLVLPYTDIFQSGLIFLAYHFGLPVIATDVGSFREEIVEGSTGYICPPKDALALQNAIGRYFESDLYKNLSTHRRKIRDYARARHSWEVVADMTQIVYSRVSS